VDPVTEPNPDPVAAAASALIAALQTQTAREPAEYLRCSESLIYAQMRDRRLRGVTIGRRRLIPMSEI
jgi:excisionase family DNA binding protein